MYQCFSTPSRDARTPEWIDELKTNEIFVFDGNLGFRFCISNFYYFMIIEK